jgi:hypothetical protein
MAPNDTVFFRNRIDAAKQAYVGYVATGMAKAVGKALGDNADEITRAVYQAIGPNGILPDSIMIRANTVLAKSAQRAIVDGWKARLPLKSAPYRAGEPKRQRLTGALGRVLSDDSMTSGTTARGVSFLNFQTLDSRARHWYRVNYGAFGNRVSWPRQPRPYPIKIDGHTVTVLHDEHQPARQSYLPVHFIYEGANWFEPLSRPAKIPGGGHRAALFTDLGFAAVAKNADRVYRAAFRSYVDDKRLRRRQLKTTRVVATNKGVM